jgi:hypothetical protein
LTVEIVEADEADFLRSGGLAKLSEWLGGAEAEQSRGLSPGLDHLRGLQPHPLPAGPLRRVQVAAMAAWCAI